MKISKDPIYVKGYIAGYQDGIKDAVSGKVTDWSSSEITHFPIKAMGISIRAKNCLLHSGYTYVGDVLALNSEEILKMRNLGHKTASEIAEWFITNGIFNSAWSEYI